jgi:hypothetical protein
MKRILPATAVLATLALAGCGVMPIPSSLPSGTSTATSSASPTPSPFPTIEADLLFTISANVTSPDGATAHLEQKVYLPSLPDDVDALEAQLDEECDGWRGTIEPAEFVIATITAVDTSTGSHHWGYDNLVGVSMNGTPVFQGDYQSFQSFCSTVQLEIPGEVRGVSPVPLHSEPDEPGGWATLQYGFGIPTEPGTDPLDDERYIQLSGCTITLSAFARTESDIAPTWLTIPQPNPEGCEVNHDGV